MLYFNCSYLFYFLAKHVYLPLLMMVMLVMIDDKQHYDANLDPRSERKISQKLQIKLKIS